MSNRVSFIVIAKDAFSKVAGRISKSTTKMRKNFASLGDGLKSLSKKFLALASAALAYISVSKFFKEGMKFQDSIADLSAITGAAGDDLAYLSEESLRLARVSKSSASDVATAFKLVASGKPELLENGKALSAVTEQVLLLSNASGIDLSNSSSVVTQSLNQMGQGADEAARFVNVLAAGSKFGASEVYDTGTAIIKAGSAAKLSSVNFEELNGTIQVLAQKGIKGAVAGTQLKTALLKMQTSSDKKLRPSTAGLAAALDHLGKKYKTATQLSDLFGLEAINSGTVLAQNGIQITAMADKITGTDIAYRQAAIRLSTFSKKVAGVGIVINEKLIRTFNKLEEKQVFTKLADEFEKWVDQIKIREDDISKMAETVRTLADAFYLVGKGIGMVYKATTATGNFLGEGTGKIQQHGPFAYYERKNNQDMLNEILGVAIKQETSGTVDVNLNAPPGVIDSASAVSTGGVNMNVGLNNPPAGAAQ